MNQFKYTLKIKEAQESTTKKKRKEIFNEAADKLTWWGKPNPEQNLWFKIATYMLKHHYKDVHMHYRAKRVNAHAGKIVIEYAIGKLSHGTFMNLFEFTSNMKNTQRPALYNLLKSDVIPYEVKFAVGKMVGELDE